VTALPVKPMPGPDFLCIGAQKAGTEWLYDQLAHHADFWMPPIKEFHYFDAGRRERAQPLYEQAVADLTGVNRARLASSKRALDSRDLEFLVSFARLSRRGVGRRVAEWLRAGSSTASRILPGYSRIHGDLVYPVLRARFHLRLREYGALFLHKGMALSGDITPCYSVLPSGVIRQIMRAFPDLKVVLFVRDPVERFWSAVQMHTRMGNTSPPDTHALERRFREPRYIHRSFQTRIAARWRRLVPAENFGVFIFDDLVKDAREFRRRILLFLGGDPEKRSGDLPHDFNRKTSHPKHPLPDEFREHLGRLFAEELLASAREFGGAATAWPAKYGL